MWILAPKPVPPQQLKGKADSDSSQQPVLLTSGDVSIGRPLKKGSTVGKADVLIVNQQSVSTIHAKLHVEAAVQDVDDFQHGSLTITDISKFGTHLTRHSSSSNGAAPAEQRLPTNEPVALQQGDQLRLGSNCRYIVCQTPLHICAPGSLTATQPHLQQQAATLNAHLCSNWTSVEPSFAAAAADAGASQHATALHATALHAVAQHRPQSCAVAATGGPLLPSVLRALIEGRPLVTPAWVEAAAAQPFWLERLPPYQQYTPEWLQLPAAAAAAAAGGKQHGSRGGHKEAAAQGRLVLGDGAWQVPGAQLLSGFKLLFEQSCEEDLLAVAAACGAHTEQLSQPQLEPQHLAARQPQAITEGLTAVLVQQTDWAGLFAAGHPQQQHQQQPEAASSIACVSEACLLLAVVRNTQQPLQAAADAFAQQHPQQQQRTPQRKRQRKQKAVAAAAAADDGDETEADATEEEEERQPMQEDDTSKADVPAAAAADAAGARRPAAQQQQQQPQQQQRQQRIVSGLLPVSPLSAAAPPTSLGGPGSTQAWRTHAPSSSASVKPAATRTTGSKRTAAAAAAAAGSDDDDDDAETVSPSAPSSSKRRKTGVAGKSPGKSPLPLTRKGGRGRQPAASQQQQKFTAKSTLQSSRDGFGDLLPGGGTLAGQQQQQDQQLVEDGCSEAVTVQLVAIPAEQGRPGVAPAADGAPCNFKAFRRRGEQQQQHGGAAAVVAEVPLLAADAAEAQGPDIDAFLRDERMRQDRLRKADELFHATMKPTGKAPHSKPPAARARK